MNCPKCCDSERIKSGKIKGRQRYKCKKCGCNYTVAIKSSAKPKSLKKKVLHLYLEGLGFRSIGRFLGVSKGTICKAGGVSNINDLTAKDLQRLYAEFCRKQKTQEIMNKEIEVTFSNN